MLLITVTLGGIVLCAGIFLYLGIPFLYGKYLRISLSNRAAKAKAIVLTFDDGPGNRLTPAILDILSEYNVKVTFFLLGRNIAGREAIVKRIAAEGHEICSHGYGHLHQWRVSPICTIKDIKQGWQAIDAVLDSKQGKYAFRPPYGKLNLLCLLYLLAKKVPIYYWSIDSEDTWRADRFDGKRVVRSTRNAGGGVILVHDFDRSEDTIDFLILELVRSVLSTSQKAGAQIIPISELFR